MALPAARLADSLAVLKTLQDQGHVAIRAGDLTRTHRERLLRTGFIREVMKGWYVPARPDEPPGESTSWYASFWSFDAVYLRARFETDWCLSPEQSLSLLTGDWTVPRQLLVRTPKGGNKPTGLLFNTSIFDMRLALPAAADVEEREGLRILKLPAALIGCSPTHFAKHSIQMRSALAMVSDASEVLGRLLDGGHSTIAARLAGAFRNIGREQIADSIAATMRAAGYTIAETDPFTDRTKVVISPRETSPYVNRLRMTWSRMREDVLQHFPKPPGIPRDPKAYLRHVDDVYVTDARSPILMAMADETTSLGLDDSLLESAARCLDTNSVRALSELQLDEAARGRLEVLAQKANEGHLAPEEAREYERFIDLSDIISTLRLKAERQVGDLAHAQ